MAVTNWPEIKASVSEGTSLSLLTAAEETVMEEEGREAIEADLETLDFFEWALRIPEPKTGTLNFEQFPFQPEMYRTMGSTIKQIVVRKATQLGISALTIRWALYEAERHGNTILYVFPTADDVNDFSDARVQPMVEGSEVLRERAGDPQNKGLKRIGPGLVYFRGSQNKHGLDSVDADGLALDEYDTLNQKNIPDAERRLSGVLSKGLIRRVGVPSLPEYGIAERFAESDQRKWVVRCGCDHIGTDRENSNEPVRAPGRGRGWQVIDFWDNVDQQAERIVCAGCGEPLDVGKGQWVAQQPDGEWPGFHVSRLIVPRMPLRDIIKASRKTSPEEVETFFNKDLGLPYVSKMARLSPEEIHAAQREFALAPGYVGGNPVTGGLDVASERALSLRISELLPDGDKRALWIGELEDDDEGEAFTQVALAMDRYRINMLAVDALPETRMARQLQGRFPGRVMIVHISGTQKAPLSLDWEQGEATVNRTIAMDATVETIRRQKNLLPIVLPDGYVQHLTANVRRVEKDEKTGRKKVYWQPMRPDDYAMAELLDVVADSLWQVRVQMDALTEESLTPLDEMLELRRSEVDQYGNEEYRPGPGSSEPGSSMYLDDPPQHSS